MEQLEELHSQRDEEKRSLLLDLEATRDHVEGGGLLDASKGEVSEVHRVRDLMLGEDLRIFEQGFNGCLAQFRSNGYFEKERPAPFQDVIQSLKDMLEEE
ncbi:XH/XS domain-containing protein [Dorcoceras hygrometricum]|uniref:XH/XS domain-containing protein n=1 Tax=Dorcoceras hygrometricum TaxID=472368 RepID=A0A2Z7C0S8_9LAMI|nr:XH/XS domain-containing protein [Dorcoceras hygrometricum]